MAKRALRRAQRPRAWDAASSNGIAGPPATPARHALCRVGPAASASRSACRPRVAPAAASRARIWSASTLRCGRITAVGATNRLAPCRPRPTEYRQRGRSTGIRPAARGAPRRDRGYTGIAPARGEVCSSANGDVRHRFQAAASDQRAYAASPDRETRAATHSRRAGCRCARESHRAQRTLPVERPRCRYSVGLGRHGASRFVAQCGDCAQRKRGRAPDACPARGGKEPARPAWRSGKRSPQGPTRHRCVPRSALLAVRRSRWDEAASQARGALRAAQGTVRHPFPGEFLTQALDQIALDARPGLADSLLRYRGRSAPGFRALSGAGGGRGATGGPLRRRGREFLSSCWSLPCSETTVRRSYGSAGQPGFYGEDRGREPPPPGGRGLHGGCRRKH